jgi:Pyruvate/2-oxoacid:ferredoxin oxidoreductase delta subunit
VEQPGLPKVNVHHFDIMAKLKEAGLSPSAYDHQQKGGTDRASYAVHNYEDRSRGQIIPASELFLGHFSNTPRKVREQTPVDHSSVLGNFDERLQALSEADARAEASRCMSCGLCFECNNCMIYCPQAAVYKVKKKEATMGRYVATDYAKCVGCHICKDVCPTGYIQMGLER